MKDKQKQSKKEENIYLTNYRQFQQKHENLLFTQFSKEYKQFLCSEKVSNRWDRNVCAARLQSCSNDESICYLYDDNKNGQS